MLKKVKIVQTAIGRWHIEGPKGNIIVGDLTLGTKLEAERYVIVYISSFRNWTYEVVSLDDKKVD